MNLGAISLVVSALSFCVASGIYLTHRERLRFDLYVRRFEVYGKSLELYNLLVTWSPSRKEVVNTSLEDSAELDHAFLGFMRARAEAKFLFPIDSRVNICLDYIFNAGFGVMSYKRDIARHSVSMGPEAAKEAYDDFFAKLNGIPEKMRDLETALEPYLRFRKVVGLLP
jgi:hypothetical protein